MLGRSEWEKRAGVRDRDGTRVKPVIKPKGSSGTVTNLDNGDGTVGRQLIVDDFPKIGRGGRGRFSENRVVMKKPISPGDMGASEELVNKLKKAAILNFQVFEV